MATIDAFFVNRGIDGSRDKRAFRLSWAFCAQLEMSISHAPRSTIAAKARQSWLPVIPLAHVEASSAQVIRQNLLHHDQPHFGTTSLCRAEYAVILETIAKTREQVGFLLCGYVLMPDHWHALIWPRFPATISKVVQTVKRISSFKLNRLRHRHGSIWQRQFWDRFVRHTQEFHQRLDYMHFNPVRKAMIKHPEEWRWSSYSNFSLDKRKVAESPIQIDYVRLPDDYRA